MSSLRPISSMAPTVLLLAVAMLLWAAVARAAAPEVVRFQGTIQSIGGGPVPDAVYTLRAEIFDVATGGTPLYTQEVDTPLVGGAYTLVLSPGTPGALAAALDAGPRFLQITVVGGPNGPIGETLLPRQELASVPFALGTGTGIPSGAIVLWDQPTGCNGAVTTCPCGYAEVTALRARFPVGADLAGNSANIPDSPSQSDGTETHQHTVSRPATGNFASGSFPAAAAGSVPSDTQAHLPPMYTLLFCRKQ